MNLSVLLLVTLPTLAAAPLPPGDHLRVLTIGEQTRSYLVHIPPSHDPKQPAPVVLAFHSAVMNGPLMARYSGLSEKANQAGFVAVYPNGTGRSNLLLFWDAGGVRAQPSDDVGFVAKLLDDLATVVNVDPNRVFATGMSNGAMMCYRLASELSDRIAAIAPVAGTMATETCRPLRPVPVMHFHGTHDPLVLFHGPDERTPKDLFFKSVESSIQSWAIANGCPSPPMIAKAPDLANDGTSVSITTYGPGKEGAEVILYAIEGGGHTWPGRTTTVPLPGLGKSTKDISASDLIWEFFQRHPKP
ncbi:extracellular catalytic domain type 1 short-chain-length polyhydroxyalkanoate depolymerase [Singulisphaera acidiphila]|uniref:Poly(3-hydroxybutyrate) depolymerase n=1 Tax=Singulisphaera acidiphila (strain ATCC BAA-1392 / DSM 18658 / VKM B-2454 / MOB10) TaxID=886293 RepID=L0DPP9_SINAD|nr:PHB depolymerase family esterase [Singulisphaera acidiphila]AGA31222.1 poly(3-hydroxybutyrate) depolymerase [Singulisphaera acidiphila DSM 18658]